MYDGKGRWIEEDDDYVRTDKHRCPKGHFLPREPELVEVFTLSGYRFLPYDGMPVEGEIIGYVWACKCGEKHAE